MVNGNLESALKFWKRQSKNHILQEVKDRREYIKPSCVRRKTKQDAIRKEYIRRLREPKLNGKHFIVLESFTIFIVVNNTTPQCVVTYFYNNNRY